MDISGLINSIDKEIAQLQVARAAIAAISAPTKRGLGRPPKSVSPVAPKKSTRKPLSEEARKKIAAAQKKRWAKQKKAAKA